MSDTKPLADLFGFDRYSCYGLHHYLCTVGEFPLRNFIKTQVRLNGMDNTDIAIAAEHLREYRKNLCGSYILRIQINTKFSGERLLGFMDGPLTEEIADRLGLLPVELLQAHLMLAGQTERYYLLQSPPMTAPDLRAWTDRFISACRDIRTAIMLLEQFSEVVTLKAFKYITPSGKTSRDKPIPNTRDCIYSVLHHISPEFSKDPGYAIDKRLVDKHLSFQAQRFIRRIADACAIITNNKTRNNGVYVFLE